MKTLFVQISLFSLLTLATITMISCGKGGNNSIDNMNNGGHLPPQPTTEGTVTTLSVDSVTSGHATITGEIVSMPSLVTLVEVGIVWDTKPHANIADYPNRYYKLEKQHAGSVRFKRIGLTGGTTYYIRIVARENGMTPVFYGKELSFTTKPPSMEYGEYYAGGVLFYVDGTGKHGLVANTDNLVYGSTGNIPWKPDFTGPDFTTSSTLGTGKSNTNVIVSHFGTKPPQPYAALVCYNLNDNGYTDWYLPSINELTLLKQHLYDASHLELPIAHFWSSTTTVSSEAWCWRTSADADIPDSYFSSNNAAVCAVRSF